MASGRINLPEAIGAFTQLLGKEHFSHSVLNPLRLLKPAQAGFTI